MSARPVRSSLGDFRIESCLGDGFLKTVYAGVNTAPQNNGFPKRVALCVPRAQDDECRRLFESELKIATALRHPSIVATYGIRYADGVFFAVTELVDGESLQELLEERGPLALEDLLPIARQVGEALDFAHASLVVHGDIRPANLMICVGNAVKVMDFGMARLRAHSQHRTADRGARLAFLAPEQFGGSTGPYTDIWALGLTCFQLLTHVHPFTGADDNELLKAILGGGPELPPALPDGFDLGLVGVFRKVLHKDPRERYRSAAEFVADLVAVSRHAVAISQQEARLEVLLRAHFPLVYLCTNEEQRALESVRRIWKIMAAKRPADLFTWSETRGLRDASDQLVVRNTVGDPVVALRHVASVSSNGIFVFLDLHRHFSPVTNRLVRDAIQSVKSQPKSLVLLSPVISLPPEFENQASLFLYDPPGSAELREAVKEATREVLGATSPNDDDLLDSLAVAALGMTRHEAGRTLRRAMLLTGSLNRACVDAVSHEKRQAVRKVGMLEYCAPGISSSDVGGLTLLRTWFERRRHAFTQHGNRFGLSKARGVMLVGVPGCGKSLSAKALAGDWNVPLLRLDMGRIYGSLLGQSEARLRQALHLAEVVSPCVLWIDELEKAFGGLGSALDGGVTQRLFGSFLNWLSDHTAPVFVVATANDVSRLPPELTRAGRFDAVFFVDLPCEAEREEIFRIHLSRRGRRAEEFDLGTLAQAADAYSGSEIEEAVVNAIYRAFDADQRATTTEDIIAGLREIVPLARSRACDVQDLRAWARQNARLASALIAPHGDASSDWIASRDPRM